MSVSFLCPSYLVNRKSSYYFRTVVPSDLRHLFRKTEIRYSLRTGFLGEAKYRARRMAGFIQSLFRSLRNGGSHMHDLTAADIQRGFDQHFRKVLEDDERERVMSRPLSEEVHHEQLEAFEELRECIRRDLALCNYEGTAGKLVDHLLRDNGITLNKDSYAYKKLCREILKTYSDIIEVLDHREQGDYEFEKSVIPSPAPMVVTPPALAVQKPSSKLLSEVVTIYVDDKKTEGRCVRQTWDKVSNVA